MRLIILLVFSLLFTAVQSMAATVDPQEIQKALMEVVANRHTVGIVVLSNSANDNDNIGLHFLDEQIPLAKIEYKKEHKEIALEPAMFDSYVGEYQLMATFTLVITKEGNQLFLQATGQPRFQLHPEAETEFFLQEVDAQISFVKDAAGKVTHLILHQAGQKLKGDKIK